MLSAEANKRPAEWTIKEDSPERSWGHLVIGSTAPQSLHSLHLVINSVNIKKIIRHFPVTWFKVLTFLLEFSFRMKFYGLKHTLCSINNNLMWSSANSNTVRFRMCVLLSGCLGCQIHFLLIKFWTDWNSLFAQCRLFININDEFILSDLLLIFIPSCRWHIHHYLCMNFSFCTLCSSLNSFKYLKAEVKTMRMFKKKFFLKKVSQLV